MKALVNILVVVAAISIVVGIISRLTLTPVRGVEAHAFLNFTNTCLLFAITLILLKCKTKGE